MLLSSLRTHQGINYDEVQQAFVGYCYGDSTCRFDPRFLRSTADERTGGQRALYTLGMTGIPVYNVNNKCALSRCSRRGQVESVRSCSTGSSAIFLARQMVRAGISDCVMALGFEKVRCRS